MCSAIAAIFCYRHLAAVSDSAVHLRNQNAFTGARASVEVESKNAVNQQRLSDTGAQQRRESAATPVQKLLDMFGRGGGQPLPGAVIAPYFAQLMQLAASGDLAVAHMLHASLEACQNRPSSQEYQAVSEQWDARQNDRGARALAAMAKQCQGFTDAQLVSDWDVVRSGAQFGDDQFRVEYYAADPSEGLSRLDPRYGERLSEHAQNAIGYLKQAAADGYANANLALADAYLSGKLVQRDYAQAYAYKVAWLQSQRAIYSVPEWNALSQEVEREFGSLLSGG